ncbi:MAG: phosphatidate cytidylyltransferase [Ktedonobacterales bacterium]
MPVSEPESGASRRERRRPASLSPGARAAWLAALGQRSLSALVLIPIVVALVFCGGWFAFAGGALALLIGMSELNAMFVHKGWHPPLLLSAALGLELLLGAMFFILNHNADQLIVMVGGGVSALLILTFAWLILTRGAIEGTLIDWALAMGSAFYLGWPIALFILLRGNTFGASASGFWWLLALFFMTWANDTFALLTGHYFGRTKLAPHISPAKTWEGFAGGLVFTVIASYVFNMLLPTLFHHPLPVGWLDAVILGVLVAIASTLGDLAESLLKRGTGVKDSGSIVPGHGGLLDRMDSLLFVVMVVFFYAVFLHGIPL